MEDLVLLEQVAKYGSPPVFLVDLRPREPPLLFITDHDVADQITRATKKFSTSIPKTPNMKNLSPLVGERSLVNLDGDEWKDLRKRIIPGFAPHHLLTLLPAMVEKTQFFLDYLEGYAKSGEEFSLGDHCTNLAFDVIGIVTFDQDLNAQIPGKESPVLTAYRECQLAFITARPSKLPLPKWWVGRHIRRLSNKLDDVLKDVIRQGYSRVLAGDVNSRSVMALSLQGIDKLTPQILQQTSDTIRGFLFAGHDTTSILMQWAFYELSRRPVSQKALRDELDEVLGPDPSPSAVSDKLLGPDAGMLVARLTYTNAVIKETLRLYPPGGTARVSPQGSGTTLALPDGAQLPVDGLTLSPVAKIIQRDPKIFGETRDDFVPERWIGPAAASIPESAWRPYERGPRRCTGAELANMEALVVLACVARQYDFVKVGLGEFELDEKEKPILDDKGYYKTKSTLFTTSHVTAKPVDSCKMKVKLSEQAQART
ncbi:hypothetical protein N8I77_009251 [Diaporthe amygdali]|uniref:Cytochrome P450 52A11 n=1 Tax=Phomopsis amygdali TaxID=1214568 RepID=A0AAD9S9D9_PHOAM|nr:hypothetical protein N8I77_009251 [Diaporthe amygdali]